MLVKNLWLVFVSAVASARIIDITIDEDLSPSVVSPSFSECTWSGTAPFCAGGCGPGQQTCRTSECGDGACCATGVKKLCCVGGCGSSTSEANQVKHHKPGSEVVVKPSKLTPAAAVCSWSGTAPFCDGSCPQNQYRCKTDNCGDGACCMSGVKAYCCTGGCPNSRDLKKLLRSEAEAAPRTGGDQDDLCGDDEFICCKPDAGVNKQCKCIKRDLGEVISRSAGQTVFRTGKDDDLCKDKETLCCNPGAGSNEECGCIDESAWLFGQEL